ncbi:MAG: beta-lactamase family protein [Colwellia sp.]|nr:beta-lactamase family protein [Colwellia sp.]
MNLQNLIFLLLFASVSVSAGSISQNTKNQLTHHLEKAQKRHGIFGQSLAVLKNGKLVYLGATGKANIEFNIPATPETIYTIFSATKLFVSTRLMQLVEQGKLELDDTLGEHFPEIPNNWKSITILQAFSHISGIPEYTQKLKKMIRLTGAEAISYVADKSMEFEAGTKSSYNQTNFYYIQKLVEKFDALTIESSIKQHALIPHKLAHTNFGGEFDIVLGRATRYKGTTSGNKRVVSSSNPPAYYYAANGMNSSVKDIAIWFQALLAGQFISKGTLEKIWTPLSLKNGRKAHHTHGWEIENTNGYTAVGHWGGSFVNVRHFFKDDLTKDTVTIIHLTNGHNKYLDLFDFSYTLASEVMTEMKTPLRTLKENMFRDVEANNLEQAKAEYAQFKKTSHDMTLETAKMINNLGYNVMLTLGPDKAIPIFELNCQDNPNSSNLFDSLAEAHLNAKNMNKAKTFYHKALELDVGNQRIQKILEGLNK